MTAHCITCRPLNMLASLLFSAVLTALIIWGGRGRCFLSVFVMKHTYQSLKGQSCDNSSILNEQEKETETKEECCLLVAVVS